MTHSSSKDVGLCLQVLGHESTIGSTQATNLLLVHEGMFGTELLRSLNDVVCRIIAIGIHVSGSKLLTESRAT